MNDNLKAARHYLGEAWAYLRAALSEAETGLRKALGR
jgi:hypothetical protein